MIDAEVVDDEIALGIPDPQSLSPDCMDLYELLGIARGATLIEIKRSYKRLARKYHPDINPGDNAAEARFKEITRAYETLSDPERRLRYDAGALSAVSTSVSFEFEGFDFSGGVAHAEAHDVRRSVRRGVLAAAGGAGGRAACAAPICMRRSR